MPAITIKNSELTVTINTLGAEMTSIKDKSGREYLWCGDPEIWPNHAPILFPIVSGLENDTYTLDGKSYHMKKHGFSKTSEFEICEHTDTEATFLLKSSKETLAVYPFEFEFRVCYSLDGRKLKIDFITDNKSEREMYYSAGSHEGFACPGGIENYTVVLDEAETLGVYQVDAIKGICEEPTPFLNNEREIKLKKSYFEVDALIFFDAKSRGAALRDDRTGESIHVAFPGFDTLLIWTKPGAEYVCIEPWCGAPDLSWKKVDDFSKKYRIVPVAKGASHTLTHTITF